VPGPSSPHRPRAGDLTAQASGPRHGSPRSTRHRAGRLNADATPKSPPSWPPPQPPRVASGSRASASCCCCSPGCSSGAGIARRRRDAVVPGGRPRGARVRDDRAPDRGPGRARRLRGPPGRPRPWRSRGVSPARPPAAWPSSARRRRRRVGRPARPERRSCPARPVVPGAAGAAGAAVAAADDATSADPGALERRGAGPVDAPDDAGPGERSDGRRRGDRDGATADDAPQRRPTCSRRPTARPWPTTWSTPGTTTRGRCRPSSHPRRALSRRPGWVLPTTAQLRFRDRRRTALDAGATLTVRSACSSR
jgi:hypothetical protein